MTTTIKCGATMPSVATLRSMACSTKSIILTAWPRIIRRLSILILPLLCAACGTFPLSGNTYGPPGKTQDQHQMDILVCKDQAKLAANTTARQTGAFLLGLTIIGTPVAFELEKAKQREVFAQCMTARGYRVDPPEAQNQAAATKPPVVPAPVVAKKEVETPAPKADDVAQLEKLKGLKDRELITEDEYNRKKKEILDGI
jgi:Short C-terminal domain